MNPRRGQLYLLKSDHVGKRRPVVIVSNDFLNGGHSVLAVPFYSQQLAKRSQQQWCVRFEAGDGGLDRPCVAKTDELSLIDKLDIDLAGGMLGEFTAEQMQRLGEAIKWSLDLA